MRKLARNLHVSKFSEFDHKLTLMGVCLCGRWLIKEKKSTGSAACRRIFLLLRSCFAAACDESEIIVVVSSSYSYANHFHSSPGVKDHEFGLESIKSPENVDLLWLMDVAYQQQHTRILVVEVR